MNLICLFSLFAVLVADRAADCTLLAEFGEFVSATTGAWELDGRLASVFRAALDRLLADAQAPAAARPSRTLRRHTTGWKG